MEIQLIAIGRTNIPFVKEGISEYSRRLARYITFRICELPDIKNSGRIPEERQKEEEGKLLLSNMTQSDTVILLDERGKEFTSVDFASFMEKRMAAGGKRILFVVGGPYGFSEAVYSRADFLLSLSKMTFNHEMARMFFTEQLYRAMTIIKGEPYHHK